MKVPLIVLVPLIAWSSYFWYLDVRRRQCIRGTLRRVQHATRTVNAGPAPFVYSGLWLVHSVGIMREEAALAVICVPIAAVVAWNLHHDYRHLVEAWHESQWPTRTARMVARLRDLARSLTAPGQATPAAGAA